ncbi:myeloid leukemia factor 1 [Brachyhypopomus gauderio]|uniref:myeloid leukemia factor 1 n=1 Tax=Brachyhypopomus gauderio TaxID=698409 RepID=UPI0040435155
MFNSLFRDFDEDPFFSDPFQAHHERMRQMMSGFADPFGHGLAPSITDGRHRGRREEGHRSTNVAARSLHGDMDSFRNPFSMMDSLMSGMRTRMEDVHRTFEDASPDTNSHAFRSSSVMTYSKVGDQPAKVFQASSQTRCAPGGIKETRRSLRDSESGVEKMSIGHHINDRGHVIEKKKNQKTGEREFNQDFQNMDETEAQAFDNEWQREVSRFLCSSPAGRLQAPQARGVHRAAIAGPNDHYNNTHGEKPVEGKKTHVSELNIRSSGMKK